MRTTNNVVQQTYGITIARADKMWSARRAPPCVAPNIDGPRLRLEGTMGFAMTGNPLLRLGWDSGAPNPGSR
jgi:hypothetical protein